MNLYTYVITRDYGFAPNPYNQYCTLATCKPVTRRVANVGDWIAGFGGSKSGHSHKLVFMMQVSEKLDFDSYWTDDRFANKKPNLFGGRKKCYGDNIYHSQEGQWVQEDSHHSYENGVTNYNNLSRDTRTNCVIASTKFWYFGKNAIDLPIQFHNYIAKGRNHLVFRNESRISELVDWLSTNFSEGINGTPFSLSLKREFRRFIG